MVNKAIPCRLFRSFFVFQERKEMMANFDRDTENMAKTKGKDWLETIHQD